MSPGLAEMIALAVEISFAGRPGCWPGWPGSPSAPAQSSGPPRPPPGRPRGCWRRGHRDPRAADRAAAAALAAAQHAVRGGGRDPPPGPRQRDRRTDGQSEDGKAGTREAKLARFFTDSGPDAARPAADGPGSSSHASSFDGKGALARLR